MSRKPKLIVTGRIFPCNIPEHGVAFHRVFDADANLLLVPNERHRLEGVPGDPNNCTLAKCGKDFLGAMHITVERSVAYVDVIRDGERVVLRFMVPRRTRDLIIKMLDGGKVPEDGAFLFTAPTWSQSLAGVQVKNDRRKQRGYKRPQGKRYAPKAPRLLPGMPGFVRSGTGHSPIARLP